MYLILSADRMAFGRTVRPGDVADLVDRYSPTSLMPGDWPEHPVARQVTTMVVSLGSCPLCSGDLVDVHDHDEGPTSAYGADGLECDECGYRVTPT